MKKHKLTQEGLKLFLLIKDKGVIGEYDHPNFSYWDLRGLVFKDMNLEDWNFQGANLQKAQFKNCKFDSYSDNFCSADLKGAVFDNNTLLRNDGRQDFAEVYLEDALNVPKNLIPIPPKGAPNVVDGKLTKAITVYKRANSRTGTWNTRRIVEMRLEKGTPVVINPDKDNKCRAAYATVVAITGLKNKKSFSEAISDWDSTFKYKVGAKVAPRHPYSADTHRACASGIHFFLDRKHAENY